GLQQVPTQRRPATQAQPAGAAAAAGVRPVHAPARHQHGRPQARRRDRDTGRPRRGQPGLPDVQGGAAGLPAVPAKGRQAADPEQWGWPMSTQQTPTQQPSPDAQRPAGPAMPAPDGDGLGPSPAPPGRRGRRLLTGAMVVAVLGGAGWWAGGHPGLDTVTKTGTAPAPAADRTEGAQ